MFQLSILHSETYHANMNYWEVMDFDSTLQYLE